MAVIDSDPAPSFAHWGFSDTTDRISVGRAGIVAWTPDRMEIEVVSSQPGIVIVHDIYYPGWVASLDGQPAQILRTNLLFRGVEVTGGRHTIVLRFEPFSLANLRNALRGVFTGHH
jgi:hypothetical protein